jgi:hypothetical protein
MGGGNLLFGRIGYSYEVTIDSQSTIAISTSNIFCFCGIPSIAIGKYQLWNGNPSQSHVHSHETFSLLRCGEKGTYPFSITSGLCTRAHRYRKQSFLWLGLSYRLSSRDLSSGAPTKEIENQTAF